MLIDKFGREITYARIAVTDRCNLRCFYCMPAEGINYVPRKDLLSYEEMERLVSIFTDLGIKKVRITGGEPFVRRDMIQFLKRLRNNSALEELHITTNGVLTEQYINELKNIGINSINLSLDTLDKSRFQSITRRDEFDSVMSTFHSIIDHRIPLKINMVVMKDRNEQDIIPMAKLSIDNNISVRYIEEMPFNGSNTKNEFLNHKKIVEILGNEFPSLSKEDDPANSTAYHYRIAGSKGNLGVIAAHTRTFCGTCNRIRVTSEGQIKNCLYDGGGLDIKALLRSDVSNKVIEDALKLSILTKSKDGHEAEANRTVDHFQSMSSIGG